MAKVSKGPTTGAKFDLDLQLGQVGEELVRSLALAREAGTIESKRDQRAWQTGNVFVEFAKWDGHQYVPSGITITEAAWWSFAIDNSAGDIEVVVLTSVERLREIYRDHRNRYGTVKGGDGGLSVGVLVPLISLVNPNQ